MRAVNGSSNSREPMQTVAATHGDLLAFAQWWMYARGHWPPNRRGFRSDSLIRPQYLLNWCDLDIKGAP